MTIIMRKSGQKRDGGDKKKALYTWSGCGLVIILTLVTVLPNVGAEPKPDYSSFSSSRMQDLAALPFGTDAEEDEFLRDNPEYKQLSNIDLLNSLFSPEERKERQIRDEEEGTPPPPDPEYKEIFKQKRKVEKAKEIIKERGEKKAKAREQFAKDKKVLQAKEQQKAVERAQKRAIKEQQKTTPQQTVSVPQQRNVPQMVKAPQTNDNSRQPRATKEQEKPTTFSGGTMAGGGGASTSVTGSIWRYEGKNINTGNGTTTNKLTSKDIDYAMQKGRAVGLDAALLGSAKGANAGDAEGAAAGAIDAFQREATAKDLDKAKQEVGIDEEADIEGPDMGIQEDLNRAINDEVDKNENNNDDDDDDSGDGSSTNDNCIKSNGSPDWSCWGMKALNSIFDTLLSSVSSCITGGCSSGGLSKSQRTELEGMGWREYNGTWFRNNGDGTWDIRQGNNTVTTKPKK